MATCSKLDEAIGKILKEFNVSALKDEQRLILETLMGDKDCMAILPTGYGKSLPYQMLIPLKREMKASDAETKVIVCSPLVALMQDQVDRLNGIAGVTAAFRGSSSEGDDLIFKGQFDYLFASPETLVSDKIWRTKLQEFSVSTIVVDEFHTICTWGGLGMENEESAFRKWFRYVGELRSMFPSACLLALSATCTKSMRKNVMKELSMKKETTTLISKSPNKPNIKFCIQRVDSSIDMAMQWLVDAIDKLKLDFPRTIIYCTSIRQLSDLYLYLCEENRECSHMIEMFHSETSEDKKKEIIVKLQDGNSQLKIILATSALGMGIDISNCNAVILYGAPSSVVDMIQQVGRIGRDGKEAVALLLHNRYHLQHVDTSVRQIYKSKTCHRKDIMSEFLTRSELESLNSETHNCCDICEVKCNCGNCSKIWIERYFYGVTEEHESDSSDTELYYQVEDNDIPEEIFDDY